MKIWQWTDDGHRGLTIAQLEQIVLKWAKFTKENMWGKMIRYTKKVNVVFTTAGTVLSRNQPTSTDW